MKKQKHELIEMIEFQGKLKQRPRFAHAFNCAECYTGKSTTKPGKSMTIPGKSLSVEQIYKRYVSGQPVSSYSTETPVFNGDTPMPDFSRMDKIDRELFRKENAKRIQALKDEIADAEKQRNAAYAEEQKIKDKAAMKAEIIKEMEGNLPT